MYVRSSYSCSLAWNGDRERGARLWRRTNDFWRFDQRCLFSSSLLFLRFFWLDQYVTEALSHTVVTFTMQIDNTLDDTWCFRLRIPHWRGTAKWNDPVETSARPSDNSDDWWKWYDPLFERMQLIGHTACYFQPRINKILVPLRVLVGL